MRLHELGSLFAVDVCAVSLSYVMLQILHPRRQSTKTRPLGVSEKGHRLSEPSTSSRRKDSDLDQDMRPHTSARVTGAVPKVPKWFKVGK